MAARSRGARGNAAAGAAAKMKKKGGGSGGDFGKAHEDQFMAAAIGDVEWLRQSLKESGAPGLFDRNGLAAVHLAAIHGRIECLRLLIEHHGCDVNSASSTGWRPVHLCISAQTGPRSLQCLLYLLEKGADHSCANDDLVTPAHQAASEGHLQALQLLIKLGAKLDQTDVRGFRPIDMAKIWGHQKCARLLASETWHREKDQLAKKLNMEKRVAMKDLLRQFERDERVSGDLRYRGNQEFGDWVQHVEGSKSAHLQRHVQEQQQQQQQQQQTPPPPPQPQQKQKPDGKQQRQISAEVSPAERYRQPMGASASRAADSDASTADAGAGRRHRLRAQINEAIAEANEILGEESEAGDGTDRQQPQQPQQQATPHKPELKLVMHSKDWNYSTKSTECFHPYQKSLEDVYPRDVFTRLPHPRKSFPYRLNVLSGHPEAALANEADRRAMQTVGRGRGAEDDEECLDEETEVRKLTPPLPPHQQQQQQSAREPQLFASKSVLDIQRRKRLDEVVKKFRGEAAAHLGSDSRSFLFRDALGLAPLDAAVVPMPASTATHSVLGSRRDSRSSSQNSRLKSAAA